jgi:flavin reductase (DIM6/NTAB) family NADH-FMN oxidoreductase RutF
MVECLMKLETGRLDAAGAWMTYTTPDGGWSLSPVGWLGIVCSRPPRISFRLHGREAGEAEFPAGSSFEINLAPFSGAADLNAPEKGDHGVEEGAKVQPLAACPVRIECRNASFDGDGRLGMVSGEVMAVHMQGVSYDLGEETPLEPIRPFARSWKRLLQPVDSSAGGGLDMAGSKCK